MEKVNADNVSKKILKFEKVKDKSGKFFNKPNFHRDKKGNLFCEVPTFEVTGDIN